MKLEEVYGIGPALAEKLKPLVGRRKFEDCYKEPEIFALLPLATKMYMKYRPVDKLKRSIIVPTAQKLERAGAIVAGSYRRGAEYCRDIDILVRREDLANLLRAAVFTKPHAEGEEIIRCFIKVSGVYMMADIFIYTPDIFPFMLLYTTGNKEFNKRMRGIAKAKGLKLNQHGLYKKNKPIADLKSELDIFTALDMNYLEPYQRTI